MRNDIACQDHHISIGIWRQYPARAKFKMQVAVSNGFHDQLAGRIHDRDHDSCLMNVEPNILFTVDQGAFL
jgi:hypothetical protein